MDKEREKTSDLLPESPVKFEKTKNRFSYMLSISHQLGTYTEAVCRVTPNPGYIPNETHELIADYDEAGFINSLNVCKLPTYALLYGRSVNEPTIDEALANLSDHELYSNLALFYKCQVAHPLPNSNDFQLLAPSAVTIPSPDRILSAISAGQLVGGYGEIHERIAAQVTSFIGQSSDKGRIYYLPPEQLNYFTNYLVEAVLNGYGSTRPNYFCGDICVQEIDQGKQSLFGGRR